MNRGFVLLLAFVAGASASSTTLTQDAQNTLTAIDTVPTQGQIDCAFNGSSSPCPSALPSLQSIAQDTTADPGIRLRAIHALVQYCTPPCSGDPAHDALIQLLNASSMARSGTDVLILRAAIESLGPMQVAGDWTAIAFFLSHPSRDIRASAAHALSDLCNGGPLVIDALRKRYQQETTDQVKIAISNALGVLATCP